MIGYGVCVGSWTKLTSYVAPRVGDRPLITLAGQTSIGAAYNRILDLALDLDALILLHDDLEITDPAGETKLVQALQPGVGLVGVAGGSGAHGLAWWNHQPVGHQQTDAMSIDFGARAGEVDLLEGSLLVFSAEAIRTLRFEPRPGFHGYDEIAAQARAGGMRVVVADVDTHHHTAMGFKTEASRADWLAADEWYRRKWGIR